MPKRAHIILPEEIIKEVDRVASRRKRSRFVEAAIREKLSREALSSALAETAGALNLVDYPKWETPEKASGWVRAIRREKDDGIAQGQSPENQ